MIRWIAERLGTSPWRNCEQSRDIKIVDVRGLRDASGNPPEVIRQLVDTAVAYWRGGQTVVISCDYGVSRSNAIAAGVLAVLNGCSYDAAIAEVITATGEQQIKLDVVLGIRAALGEEDRTASKRGTFVIGSETFLGRSLTRALSTDNIEYSDADGGSLSANSVLLDALIGSHAPERLLFCWHPPQLDTNRAIGVLISSLRNVLEVCRLRGTGIVFVSGHQIFAARNDDTIYGCAENEEAQPAGAVGDGFYLAEQLVKTYASRHCLETLVIRPTHLYGSNDERPSFLNTFLRKALVGSDIETHQFANGTPVIDVLHVDDFARGVVLAIRSNVRGILHLASGNVLSSSELARMALKANGIGTIRTINLPGRCSRTVLDASMARRILNWRPEIALEEGLHDALACMKINTTSKEQTQND